MNAIRLPANRRDRRALFIGAVIVVASLALRLAAPITRYARTLHARALVVAQQVAESRALIAEQPALRDSLGARAARLVALAPLFIAGRTEADAQAELAGVVSTAAVRHRIRIMRQDARPDTGTGLLPRATLHFDAEGDVAGIVGWLAELEAGPRLVDVSELTIDAPTYAALATQAETLHVGVTLAAIRATRGGE